MLVVRVIMFVVVGIAGLTGGVKSLMGLSAQASDQWDGDYEDFGGCSDGSGATCGSCCTHMSQK